MSWGTAEVQEVLDLPSVQRILSHHCHFGQQAFNGAPIKKPTGFMTNCAGISKALNKTIKGQAGGCSRAVGGEHILCHGRVARRAAVYLMRFCRAVLVGLRNHLRHGGMIEVGAVGMLDRGPYTDVVDVACANNGYSDGRLYFADGYALRIGDGCGPFFDDLTGQPMPLELVKQDRRKEFDYFAVKQAWRKISIDEAWRLTGRPPISVRWVDVDKADDEAPEIRSRLVARQIRGRAEAAGLQVTMAEGWHS